MGWGLPARQPERGFVGSASCRFALSYQLPLDYVSSRTEGFATPRSPGLISTYTYIIPFLELYFNSQKTTLYPPKPRRKEAPFNMWGGEATGESTVLPAPVLVHGTWYFESQLPSFPAGRPLEHPRAVCPLTPACSRYLQQASDDVRLACGWAYGAGRYG